MFLSQSNLDILYEVLEEYTINASKSITVPPELENYKFSEQFERRMKRLINRRSKSYYMLINTVSKRVACYVIIAFLCLFVTVFSVKALREPFINFVVQTYEKFTSIFVEKTEPADNVEFKVMLPTYIPEGYEVVEEYEDKNMYMRKYKNSYGDYLIYTQNITNTSWFTTIDTEKKELQHIIIRDLECIYTSDSEMCSLTFNIGKYAFNILTNEKLTEIIKIVETIE